MSAGASWPATIRRAGPDARSYWRCGPKVLSPAGPYPGHTRPYSTSIPSITGSSTRIRIFATSGYIEWCARRGRAPIDRHECQRLLGDFSTSRAVADGQRLKRRPSVAAGLTYVTELRVDACARCGEDLTDTACTGHERRTLVDSVFEKVVRHADADIKHCPRCHTETRARFPAEMPGPPPVPPRRQGLRRAPARRPNARGHSQRKPIHERPPCD